MTSKFARIFLTAAFAFSLLAVAQTKPAAAAGADPTPGPAITQNEIDAAKSVRFDEFNTQGQPSFVWPANFAVARAYVDQLQRSNGLGAARLTAIRGVLTGAERSSGSARREELTQLATQLDADAGGSSDASKVRLLATQVRSLASASTASTAY